MQYISTLTTDAAEMVMPNGHTVLGYFIYTTPSILKYKNFFCVAWCCIEQGGNILKRGDKKIKKV